VDSFGSVVKLALKYDIYIIPKGVMGDFPLQDWLKQDTQTEQWWVVKFGPKWKPGASPCTLVLLQLFH
jgi:hypothetical protein